MRRYLTTTGNIVLLVLLAIVCGTGGWLLPWLGERMEAKRCAAVQAAGEREVLGSLEAQIEAATGREAKCRIEEPLFVELIPEKTYRAIVLCDDGEMLLTNVIDVTRFGADDELFWQTNGFAPAKAQQRKN